MDPQIKMQTLSSDDHTAIARAFLNLQDERDRAKRASVAADEFQEGLSGLGKVVNLAKPFKSIFYGVAFLIALGWGGYEVVHRFITKEDLKEVIEQHSEAPHDTTSTKMSIMQQDVDDIETGVNELKAKSVRNESVQKLQIIRGKYVEDLAEYNARGRRGKKPPRPSEIDTLEAELLK